MTVLRSSMLCGLAAFLAVGFASPVAAAVVDPRELSLAIDSTIVDFDLMMIDTFLGPSIGTSLTYASLIDRDGWDGRLLGNFGGNSVDIHYQGSIVPLDSDGKDYSFSYASQWLINGTPGLGSGSGASIDPFGDVSITMNNMEVSGSIQYNSGLASITISAKKDFDNHVFTADGTVGVFTVPVINTSLVDGTIGFKYDQDTGSYSSFVRSRFARITLYKRTINRGSVAPERPIFRHSGFEVPPVCTSGEWCNPPVDVPVSASVSHSTILVTDVPEPASWALMTMGFGVLGMGLRARRDAVAD